MRRVLVLAAAIATSIVWIASARAGTIVSNVVDDSLSGESGNDELSGGQGDDTCRGGPGADSFVSC